LADSPTIVEDSAAFLDDVSGLVTGLIGDVTKSLIKREGVAGSDEETIKLGSG